MPTAYMLYNAATAKEDKAPLGSDPSATAAAYSIWAVTFVLPFSYKYAGAYNAINPCLCDYFCIVTICFYNSRPLSKPAFRCIKFTHKLPTNFGTIIKNLRNSRLKMLIYSTGRGHCQKAVKPIKNCYFTHFNTNKPKFAIILSILKKKFYFFYFFLESQGLFW